MFSRFIKLKNRVVLKIQKNIGIWFLVLMVLLGIFLWWGEGYVKKVNIAYQSDNLSSYVFVVQKGDSVKNVAMNLESAGLIADTHLFEWYVKFKRNNIYLLAGEYNLSPSMTIVQIVDILTNKTPNLMQSSELKVVIPEGYNNQEVYKKLAILENISNLKSLDEVELDLSMYPFVRNNINQDNYLQGYLFPDTYLFYKDASASQIVGKMLNNFKIQIDQDLLLEIEGQGKTLYDVLIMASIIEKEAANIEEMPVIASVFYNRLAIGQKLQSDATVNYVVGEGRAQATLKDLEIDSKFNTYKYNGLPPSPICNPGLAAIKAAIFPAKTEYFYFLTTQDDKRITIFSKTYAEHLANKRKYLSKK